MKNKQLAAMFKSYGYSQSQVAEKTGLGIATIKRWWSDLSSHKVGAFIFPTYQDNSITEDDLRFLWWSGAIYKSDKVSDKFPEYCAVDWYEYAPVPDKYRIIYTLCSNGLLLLDVCSVSEDAGEADRLGIMHLPGRVVV